MDALSSNRPCPLLVQFLRPLPSFLLTMTVSITLPWPDRHLFPNDRCHWAVKAKQVKKHRRLAYYEALEIQSAIPDAVRADADQPIFYRIIYTPKINRHRDEDGIISSCKAYLDGISEAIGINDYRFHIRGCEALPAKRPGSIVIELDWETTGGHNA